MKRNMKKLLSAILVLVMTVALLPATAHAEADHHVWVGGVWVDSSNAHDVLSDGGSVVFHPGTMEEFATLTLNNAKITGAPAPWGAEDTVGIYSDIGLTLELIGSSTVTGTDTDAESYGIYVQEAQLNITGEGTLDVTAGNADDLSCAVYADFMDILSGTLRATGGKAAVESEGVYSVFCLMDGGALIAAGGEAPKSWGVGGYATLDGGTVTATGQTRAFSGDPEIFFRADPIISVNTLPSAQGAAAWNGTDKLGEDGGFRYVKVEMPVYYRVLVGGVLVTEENRDDVLSDGGSVVFTPAAASEAPRLTLNNAEITGAPGLDGPENTAGIFSYENSLTLELAGDSTVTGTDADYSSFGILVMGNDLTVTGDGTLDVTAGAATADSCAVSASTVIMLSGTVRATGGRASNMSAGINGGLRMEGGTLTATGGDDAYVSYGVGYGVAVNRGTVTAVGQTGAFYSEPDLSGSGNSIVMVNIAPSAVNAEVWNGTDSLTRSGGFRYVQIQAGMPFADTPWNAFYVDAVLWAVDNGVTTGTSATTFSPGSTCTRAQVVTFLWRASGSPEPANTDNPFSDVKADQYYYKAVLWAVEKGVTTGTAADKFSPDAGCTRGQVVTFLHRAQGSPAPGSAVNPFTDVPAGQYYSDAVLWAVNHSPQITNGTSATTFSPNATCTRGQIVTFLYRALN